MNDCIFCKIVNKQLPSQMIYEDDQVVAVKDTNPKAPVHLLIIPHQHIATLNDVKASEQQLLGHSMLIAKKLATEAGVHESGYRLVYNVNRGAGQSIFHLHLHVLGGRLMDWPPG